MASTVTSSGFVLFIFTAWAQGITISRRRILQTGLLNTGCVATFVCSSRPAFAFVRGAAELDLEYYMRDLLGGNQREGSVLPSNPPSKPPPRVLKDPLLSLLLNDDCSSACLVSQALIRQVQTVTGREAFAIEREIQDSVIDYRDKSKKSFYARAPWEEEHVSDQYYFDLTAYALWRTAADLLPNYVDRDLFVRELGRLIFDKAVSKGSLKEIVSIKGGGLFVSVDLMKEILDTFVASGFCKSYRLGENNNKNLPLFDELDVEALVSGGSVDCLVSIIEPACLGACLQITGEQSRFSPDFVGPTLAAMWSYAGIHQSSWESFFVDPVYRPNPKDYFPNEQLLQFTLSLE